MIKIHNSQSRQLEEFVPQMPEDIKMYVCGPTVYGPAHIGNARPAIVFDQMFRLLRHVYGEDAVVYARNITDIDDKIIAAANAQNVPITRITDTATAAYRADLQDLNCLEPSYEPQATAYVTGMIGYIQLLMDKGHAYGVDGEIFFHVPSNPYPGLANHTALESGSRVEVDPRKKDPRDFVLWKPAKVGEPSWYSPFGIGRPGWHIECTTMIRSLLGDTLDIHGGGADLRFPHHEAECAQSQCISDGAPLANYWMHNGLLTVDDEKMSKSRGNVIMLSELFERVPAESVRYYFLQSHYRSPMNFTYEGLEASHRALSGLYDALYRCDDVNYAEDVRVHADYLGGLLNDLNTPQALSTMHQLANDMERADNKGFFKGQLLALGRLLGLFESTPHQWRTFGVDKDAVDALVQARQEARRNKDYAGADAIRQQLLSMGITLADGVHGTEWRRA